MSSAFVAINSEHLEGKSVNSCAHCTSNGALGSRAFSRQMVVFQVDPLGCISSLSCEPVCGGRSNNAASSVSDKALLVISSETSNFLPIATAQHHANELRYRK